MDDEKSIAKAIRALHGCDSLWIKSIPEKEIFKGQTVWEGIVQVFELIDHPTAKKCYAWSHLVDESGKRKFIAVFHEGPVDSPEKAVRASIVSEYRNK